MCKHGSQTSDPEEKRQNAWSHVLGETDSELTYVQRCRLNKKHEIEQGRQEIGREGTEGGVCHFMYELTRNPQRSRDNVLHSYWEIFKCSWKQRPASPTIASHTPLPTSCPQPVVLFLSGDLAPVPCRSVWPASNSVTMGTVRKVTPSWQVLVTLTRRRFRLVFQFFIFTPTIFFQHFISLSKSSIL